jgi:hypothetical protein
MPLDTDAAKVREIMLEALNANEATLDTPAPVVTLDDITTTAMTFTGVAYVRGPREASAVKSALLFDILSRLAKSQLPLSTPQSMIVRNLGPLGEDSPAAPMSVGVFTPAHACLKPLSLRERGWGEGTSSARCQNLLQVMIIALRPNPHPPLGTLSRRERDSLSRHHQTHIKRVPCGGPRTEETTPWAFCASPPRHRSPP